jgi:4-nitrophenyl phosphatase
VFVIGEPELHRQFESRGLKSDAKPDAVVVGICRTFTYDLLREALHHVQAGAVFLATNRDATYPLEDGVFDPGAGSLVAALETCSGVSPEVVGKPGTTLLTDAMQSVGVAPHETIMVGDRRDTDVHAGHAAGCRTWLVLTGVEHELANEPGSHELSGLAKHLGW